MRVVSVTFFESQFAPDDLVPCRGISLELDAPDIELLALIDVDFQKRQLLFVVKRRAWHRREVNVAGLAVSLAQVVDPFGHLFAAEDIPILDREQRPQRGHVLNRFVVLERNLAQPIFVTFLNRHGDVDRFARTVLHQWNVEALVTRIVDFRLGIPYYDFEVAAVLVFRAHSFGIFFQFGRVVGLGENVLQENRVRNADRPQVFHRRPQSAGIDVLVAFELDLAYLDLRPLFDHKRDPHRRRRNLPHLSANRGELPSVLRQQLLDGYFRLLDACGIVLALLRKAHFGKLEAFEHIAGRD